MTGDGSPSPQSQPEKVESDLSPTEYRVFVPKSLQTDSPTEQTEKEPLKMDEEAWEGQSVPEEHRMEHYRDELSNEDVQEYLIRLGLSPPPEFNDSVSVSHAYLSCLQRQVTSYHQATSRMEVELATLKEERKMYKGVYIEETDKNDEERGMKPCNWGSECRHLLNGLCHNTHPPDEEEWVGSGAFKHVSFEEYKSQKRVQPQLPVSSQPQPPVSSQPGVLWNDQMQQWGYYDQGHWVPLQQCIEWDNQAQQWMEWNEQSQGWVPAKGPPLCSNGPSCWAYLNGGCPHNHTN